MTQLDRWRRDFGATQQRRGNLLGLFSSAAYRAGNLSENLSVALDQKFGQATITPPEAGPRCRRLRTGSKRSAFPSTVRENGAHNRTESWSVVFRLRRSMQGCPRI